MSHLEILLADDDALSRDFLAQALESCGATVTAVDDGHAAIKVAARRGFDLVLTDLRMPRKDGMDVLRAVKERSPHTPVIIVTAYGTVEAAVKALRAGAADVLVKPVDPESLELLLVRVAERRRLVEENVYLRESQDCESRISATSEPMRLVLDSVKAVASSSTTVLITGESGTGKEVVASEIQRRSDRARNAFIKVNCAAIPLNLMESEFFGHEPGAFTGAGERRIGKFELADRGTLLLDEVGEIDLAVQAKLLRVLEDGIVERVGGSEAIRVDVRVIAATNKDIAASVRDGTFREDLFYRLNIFPIALPPLRARPEDVVPLAELFLGEEASARGRQAPSLSAAARAALEAYDWPGNVRELRNLMQRALIVERGDELRAEVIGPWIRGEAVHVIPAQGRPGTPVRDPVEELVGRKLRDVEDALILATLAGADGNRTRAAHVLGINPRTLYNRLRLISS